VAGVGECAVRSWTLNGEDVPLVSDGPRGYGDPVVLLDADDDLTAGCAWADAGYTVAPFLTTALRDAMRREVAAFLEERLRALGYAGPAVEWSGYHQVAAADPALHERFIAGVRRGFKVAEGPVPVGEIEAAVGRVCGRHVTAFSPHLRGAYGCFRIV